MKTINFNGKDYQIPQNWNEITIDMLIKSGELAELLPNAPVVAVVSAYTGIPVKDLNTSKANEVIKILEEMEFVKEEYKPVAASSFTFNDEVYFAEEDMINQKFEDWVALQTIMNNYENDKLRALPYMLAILCKKENECLDDFNLDERARMLSKLPMTTGKDVEAFFLQTLSVYNVLSHLSSIVSVHEELVLGKVKELEDTLKKLWAQTGIFSGTKIRIGIYRLQLWWVKKVLEKYCNSQHSKK
jgi:hypothetical protein